MFKHLSTTLALVLLTGCAAEAPSAAEDDLRGSETVRAEVEALKQKVEDALRETTLEALKDSQHPCLTDAMAVWDNSSARRTSAAGTMVVEDKTIYVIASFDRKSGWTFIEALAILDGKMQLVARGGKEQVLPLDAKMDVTFRELSNAYPFMRLDACR